MEFEFGNKLKRLRENSRLSQEELADKMHVSRQAVYKWETNKGYPDIQNLIRISDIFDVTIDELIRNDQDLQEKISIDEDKTFEHFSDLGFYLGIILIFLGVFLFDGATANTLYIAGLLTILFLSDIIKSLHSIFQDTK